MRYLIILMAFLIIPFLGYGQGCPSNYNTTLTTPELRQWNPAYTYTILDDEFNLSSLDSAIWGVRTGCVRNTDVEAQHYKNSPNNVSLSNGTLKLIARKETTWDWIAPPPGVKGDLTWGKRDYTSGEIYSLNESFHYGEYTIGCRFPVGSGSWAAFWMFGCVPGQCNEIDFFEQNRREGKNGAEINSVFHWYYSNGTCGPMFDDSAKNVNNWHIYRCTWTPYETKFYVDDMNKPIRKWSRYATLGLQYVAIEDIVNSNSYVYNANYPIYPAGIIANYALYNDVTIDDSVLPQPFEIDYIRVREFFLAPEIICPAIICSTGTATMDVAPAATNISWALSPAYLFSGAYTDTGTTANITAAASYHGK